MSLKVKPVLATILSLMTLEAKRQVYGKVLSKSNDEMTPHEIEIGFALACDKDIQKFLSENMK